MAAVGMTILTWVILGIMVLALFGLVVPIFPGGVVIWLAALVYGVFAGFDAPGGVLFGIMTLLMVASTAADNFLMGAKAIEAGASWRGIGAALLAGLIGGLFLTPIMGLVLAAAALYFTEYLRLGDRDKAIEITKGLMIGCGWAFVVRFGLGVVKIILWAFWAFGG